MVKETNIKKLRKREMYKHGNKRGNIRIKIKRIEMGMEHDGGRLGASLLTMACKNIENLNYCIDMFLQYPKAKNICRTVIP